MPDYLQGMHAKPGMAFPATQADHRSMEIEQNTDNQGDRPQWMGSVARRNNQLEAQPSVAPVTEDEGVEQAAAWKGSAERSALFAKPLPEPEPVPVAVAPLSFHEQPASERIVMGALGMTLRVAA